MDRTIRVTGTGNISVKPDITIISMKMSMVKPTYEEAVKASADASLFIRKIVEYLGFNRDSLRTTDFSIDTHYVSHYDEKNNRHSKFDGYKFNQTLKLTFDSDNKTLGRVLYELSKIPYEVEMGIYYGVKDIETQKNILLKNAIKDAKAKAEIITEASGVKLGEILDINYSWLDINFTTHYFNVNNYKMVSCYERLAPAGGAFDIDINPRDIENSDNVTLIFKIY